MSTGRMLSKTRRTRILIIFLREAQQVSIHYHTVVINLIFQFMFTRVVLNVTLQSEVLTSY